MQVRIKAGAKAQAVIDGGPNRWFTVTKDVTVNVIESSYGVFLCRGKSGRFWIDYTEVDEILAERR